MSKRVIRDFSNNGLPFKPKGKKRASVPIGLDRFNQTRSQRIDLFRPRSASKTKSLIRFLLGHGARSQRATLPKKYIKLRVCSPNGGSAVRLNFH